MDHEKIRRVRESIALGHYDPKTLEGEFALHRATDRLLTSWGESTSTSSRKASDGAAPADETDSP